MTEEEQRRPADPYYDRQGRAISPEEWSGLFGDPAYKQVAETTVGGIWISTVWLGLDHGWGTGPPVIFETMAFAAGISWAELAARRYGTEAQARAGHDQLVALARRRHHGWVKHARDERRREAKYYRRLLEQPDRSEAEEASLRLWLARR